MSTLQVETAAANWGVEIELPDSMVFSAGQFDELCRRNPDLKAELSCDGDLTILAPTGGNSGWRNSTISAQLQNWTTENGAGIAFDSSTLFALPNGARRGPDAAWLTLERWEELSNEEQDGFPPLCPDFVLELGSKTDGLKKLATKMEEYIENGARLGFLIDPMERCVHIYRPSAAPEVLESPEFVSADTILPGFEMNLTAIWGNDR